MTQALAAHLLQTTLFALAVGLMTRAFRSNRAQVRYWLWLSATLKFLVPFALLLNLGSYLETLLPAARQIATPLASNALISYTFDQFSTPPSPDIPSPLAPATDTTPWLPIAGFTVWLIGFATLAGIRIRAWLRIREAVRRANPTGIPSPVPVRVSPLRLEPGVVGIARPVILLPEGISERLTPSEIETVLAHELCHVRRHDNLFAAIHMIVEAVFWFHPLVWWTGMHLVEERERACDEEVLSRGSHPEVYADAILNVCKLYVQSPLACVSGVSGAGIRRRIEAILLNRRLKQLNRGRKLLLATAATVALAGPITLGLLIAAGEMSELPAQTPISPRQKFEVASIHRCGPDTVVPLREGGGFGDLGTSTNRVSRHCYTVTTLLQAAYVIFADGQNRMFSSVHVPAIEKAPGWMSSDLYSIDAKAEGAPGQAVMLGPMMQSLLEDRFHLKLHRETRTGPAYELTMAKGGAKLKLNDGSCGVDLPPASAPRDPATGKPASGFTTGRVSPPREPGVPCRLRFSLKNGPNQLFVASAMSLDDFSAMLSRAVGRTIINKTGITGKFDIRLEYFPDDVALDPPADLQHAASLFTALEEQLGLKLTATRGTREVIVIDHIEKPTGN